LPRRPAACFSRDGLLEKLYADHRVVTDRTVDAHVKNLRRKLKRSGPGRTWCARSTASATGWSRDGPHRQDRPRPRLPRHRRGAGYWVYREYWSPDSRRRACRRRRGRGGPMGAGGPTPVVGAPASLGNVDIVLNGLGTATPLRTVTVRSRVDGELMRVLFSRKASW
jgi:hypothetical protein